MSYAALRFSSAKVMPKIEKRQDFVHYLVSVGAKFVTLHSHRHCFRGVPKVIDSVKIKEVLAALERFAPLPLQEDWDNAGLQIGLTEEQVSGALLSLDVTDRVIDEAIGRGCNLIVSHHPLLFHPLRRLAGSTAVERMAMRLIEKHIAVVSMHTNMDNALGGVNFKMAEKMGLINVRPLVPDKQNAGKASGAIGEFMDPMAADDFVAMLKRAFSVEALMCNELLRRRIKTVAMCGGAGSFMLKDALECGADAFVTGEMHYHEYFYVEQKIQIAVLGHCQSERFTSEIFQSIIREKCPQVEVFISREDTNPIIYL